DPPGKKTRWKATVRRVATPVRSAFPAAGENWSTRARALEPVQERGKTSLKHS
ncbi:hypothetical protein B0H10DRAFT_2137146, partial [Mycena sp. CBHHK59/15]